MTEFPASATSATDPVVLAAGDTLKISFPGAAEYNDTQRITPDGNIFLPFVGPVHAAGKSISELQSELSKKYASQLQNSEVVVTLASSNATFIISGGVRAPGKFTMDHPVTLLEAVFLAGGFNEFANRHKIRLIRVSGGEYTTQVFDLAGAMHGKAASLVYVKGGDMIEVDERTW